MAKASGTTKSSSSSNPKGIGTNSVGDFLTKAGFKQSNGAFKFSNDGASIQFRKNGENYDMEMRYKGLLGRREFEEKEVIKVAQMSPTQLSSAIQSSLKEARLELKSRGILDFEKIMKKNFGI